MGTTLNSIDNMLAQDASTGCLRRLVAGRLFAPSAATASCGGIGISRADPTFTIPSLGVGITAAYLSYGRMATASNFAATLIAYEVLMGTFITGTGFSVGSTMPTRTIEGTSIQTGTLLPVVVCTNVTGATAPVFTATYTDQDGNTSQTTASVTLPAAASDRSTYWLAPHLASGDTGVQAITNMTFSANPTTGTFKIYGLFPLAIGINGVGSINGYLDPLTIPFPIFPLLASDNIAFYGFGMASASDFVAAITLIGDN